MSAQKNFSIFDVTKKAAEKKRLSSQVDSSNTLGKCRECKSASSSTTSSGSGKRVKVDESKAQSDPVVLTLSDDDSVDATMKDRSPGKKKNPVAYSVPADGVVRLEHLGHGNWKNILFGLPPEDLFSLAKADVPYLRRMLKNQEYWHGRAIDKKLRLPDSAGSPSAALFDWRNFACKQETLDFCFRNGQLEEHVVSYGSYKQFYVHAVTFANEGKTFIGSMQFCFANSNTASEIYVTPLGDPADSHKFQGKSQSFKLKGHKDDNINLITCLEDRLAFATNTSHVVKICDLGVGTKLQSYTRGKNLLAHVSKLMWSPNRLVSLYEDGVICVFDPRAKKTPQQTFSVFSASAGVHQEIQFLKSAGVVALGMDKDTYMVKSVDIRNGKALSKKQLMNANVNSRINSSLCVDGENIWYGGPVATDDSTANNVHRLVQLDVETLETTRDVTELFRGKIKPSYGNKLGDLSEMRGVFHSQKKLLAPLKDQLYAVDLGDKPRILWEKKTCDGFGHAFCAERGFLGMMHHDYSGEAFLYVPSDSGEFSWPT